MEPREHRLLRDIERTIGVPLELVGLPTVADVREKRLEILRGTLRETLLGDGFDRYRAVVEPLSDEFDLVDIALAAISLADAGARGAEDTAELAPATLPPAFGARGTGRPRGAQSAPETRRRPRCDAMGGAGSTSTRAPRRTAAVRDAAAALSRASKAEATDARRDRIARSRRAPARPSAATA